MSTDQLRTAVSPTAGKELGPTGQFGNFLEKYKGQIEKALPTHMKVDRMIRLALTAFSSSKQLQSCDMNSIFGALVQASQMGLEPGVNGQGYIIPYKGKATFVPGWKGIVDLVSRAGRATVWTGAVYQGDEFEFVYGTRPDLKHKPCGEDDPKKLLYTYSVGWVKEAEWPIIEVWPAKKLLAHRDRMNKVGAQHYSYAHWEMYCRKIPLLQVCKYLPSSVELNTALQNDEDAERGATATFDGGMTFDGETGEVLQGGQQQGGTKPDPKPDPTPEPEQKRQEPEPTPEPTQAEDEPPPGAGRKVDPSKPDVVPRPQPRAARKPVDLG